MNENQRIKPFIKYSCGEQGQKQMESMDVQKGNRNLAADNFLAEGERRNMLVQSQPVWPAPCPGYGYPIYQDFNYYPANDWNLLMAGFTLPVIMAPLPESWMIVRGSYTDMDVSIQRGGNREGEKAEMPEQVVPDKLPDQREPEPGKEKAKKKQQGDTEERCHWFMQKMFFLISEGVIKLSRDKESYKQEMDLAYGFLGDGWLYLKPQETFEAVKKALQPNGESENIPKRVHLEHYLYQLGILEREGGKKPSYQKKIAVNRVRWRYWCIHEERLSGILPEIGKGRKMLPEGEDPKKDMK